MKRDSDSLEVIPAGEGLSVSTMQGLSSPPLKKMCLDGKKSPATERMENMLSSSGLSSPPMMSPVPYTTGGAEVAEGGASPQPATEAEEKEAEATSIPGATRRGFPCVWLNGSGEVDNSPTKPSYDQQPIVSFWLIWYSTKRAYVIMICPSCIVVIRHRHRCCRRLCTALLATGFRIETSYLV